MTKKKLYELLAQEPTKFALREKELIEEYNIPVEKYAAAGIYTIGVADKVVYVGKSKDMLNRICNHIQHIKDETEGHKYKLLKGIQNRGYTITFNVLEYCGNENLDEKEVYWINEIKPYLNSQFPYFDKEGKVRWKTKSIKYETVDRFEAYLNSKDLDKFSF